MSVDAHTDKTAFVLWIACWEAAKEGASCRSVRPDIWSSGATRQSEADPHLYRTWEGLA